MPEFMVIAIVALVVLGPERLPEVMRRVGQFYRQARELATQYTGEAQRMLEEGMREVEDVSSTINSAWQDATVDSTSSQPPPRLRQLPPPLVASSTAADAGPWMLPAWQRDSTADREPQSVAFALTPFTLPRLAPVDEATESLAGIGGPSLMGPAPTEAELAEMDAMLADLPDVELPQMPRPAPAPEVNPTLAGADSTPVLPNGVSTDVPGTGQVLAQEGAPVLPNGAATVPHVNGTHGAASAPLGSTGSAAALPTSEPSDESLGEAEPEGSPREQTVIELYLQGDITWQKAAAFLNLSPTELLDRVERARRALHA